MSITWSSHDGIVELALGREPCNEIGTGMLDDLERFLAELDVEHTAALVMHSTVRGGFSAGADLRELYHGLVERPPEQQQPAMRDFIDRIHRVMDTLDMLPMTTIGVVHGVCFGGGFELALTCDVLIAERSARFCFPELRLGILPGFGGIPRLRRDVGNGLVRDLLLTGRSINAKKALAAGLVSQMVPTGEGIVAARAVAAQATKFDRDALVTTKRFMKPIPRAELDAEKEHFLRLAQRPPLREALKRFVQSDDLRPYLP
ncbi:MAG: enoyl-CoA hydratase/isomerase family protein [Deltaproteobacteria bacterium]|nr:enoyl-CoA hydratase/isomerase family protein [Deltaproteobacteria bacterium]MBK8240845.1 enoyl-CoA hydratase/isomerase family protein [Deltaproteobacteria bacterium]MBK8714152.1 enoyl-CoA hydratase/isomerase family protein [Deltaproteobacteria bacterium]MBP7285594.1 enoyl-CoA hydratase/isomerase family protein [Nannocystaceae bacterium]